MSALFGGSIRIVPRLLLTPELRDGLRAAFRAGTAQPGWDDATLHPAAWDWLSRVARVRDAARHLDDLMLYDSAVNSSASALRVAQMPPRAGESWIGLPGPSASLPGGRVSLVALTPGGSLISIGSPAASSSTSGPRWCRARHTPPASRFTPTRRAPRRRRRSCSRCRTTRDRTGTWPVSRPCSTRRSIWRAIRMVGPKALGPANHFLPATLLAFNPDSETVSTDLVSLG